MTVQPFTLLSDAQLDPQAREALESLPPLNVFRAAAGAPSVLGAFVDMAVALLGHTELPAHEREIAFELAPLAAQWRHQHRLNQCENVLLAGIMSADL